MNNCCICNTNWDAISAIIDGLSLLAMWIPLAIIFVHSYLKILDCWIGEDTGNGIVIYIHNRTKYSIYISGYEIRTSLFKKKGNYEIKKSSICIKSDEIYPLKVDFFVFPISLKSKFYLKIEFAQYKRHYFKTIKRKK